MKTDTKNKIVETEPAIVEPEVENKRIIRLTKHYSPDTDMTYYLIRLESLNLYGNKDLEMAKERFAYILKIGLKAYLEEIKIQIELIAEQEVIEPLESNE